MKSRKKEKKKEARKKERNGTNQKRRKPYRKEGQRELTKTISSKRERQPQSLSGDGDQRLYTGFVLPQSSFVDFILRQFIFPHENTETKSYSTSWLCFCYLNPVTLVSLAITSHYHTHRHTSY